MQLRPALHFSAALQHSVVKYTAAAESAVRAEERGGGALPRKLRGFEEQQVMTNHLLQEISKGIWALVDLKHTEVSPIG